MRAFRLMSLLTAAIILPACGGGTGHGPGRGETRVSLHAGKGVSVELTLPSEEFRDSLRFHNGDPVELILRSENCVSSLSAMLVPGCGSTPADRMRFLSDSGVSNLDTNLVNPHGEIPPFTAVLYVRGDSSVVERIWNMGGGELAVLRVRARNISLNILLTSVSGILSTARLSRIPESLEREVYLSHRTREEIVLEVNADVTPPPEITHRIHLYVDPPEKSMTVLDTLTIDFSTTQADSRLNLFIPGGGNGTGFEALVGSMYAQGDSVVCIAGPSRSFTGVYSGTWNGFLSSTTDGMTSDGMRIDRSVSFQCGMWFYPGCGIPSAYDFHITVPDGMGYDVYAPLNESYRVSEDSVLTVSYASPIGGVKGPLAWAVGGFTQTPVADGRSMFICPEPHPADAGLTGIAEDVAGVLWRNFGYEGARLDIVMVNVLDFPVMIRGPGCLFISGGMMESLEGHEGWVDSISSGVSVPGTWIIFEAARAFLSGSTYLSGNLRDAMAAWAVCRFITSASPEATPRLMEALRKHYLYSTEIIGGIEYAIADPMLRNSDLYDAVIMDKAPMVMHFLSLQVPAFERAVPRALGNLRHSGDSFSRLFSAMGVMENSRYGEMYFRWMYGPGLPLLEVEWADSSGVIKMRIEQVQPGQEFPLGSVMDQVTVYTATGTHRLDTGQGPAHGYYTADTAGLTEDIRALDIDPHGTLPADIVYRRRTAGAGGI